MLIAFKEIKQVLLLQNIRFHTQRECNEGMLFRVKSKTNSSNKQFDPDNQNVQIIGVRIIVS